MPRCSSPTRPRDDARIRGLALLLLVLFLNGCGFTYHFRDGDGVRGEEHDEWASYFLFGLVGDHEIDVRELCPQGVYEITTGTNFLTWLVTMVTVGIYNPRKVNVWCNAGSSKVAYQFELGADGKPVRVTQQRGERTYSGVPRRVADGRWGVALREGGAL